MLSACLYGNTLTSFLTSMNVQKRLFTLLGFCVISAFFLLLRTCKLQSMVSYHGNSSHSEPARMEQIITEFFAKSLHIILESRCPYVSSRNYSGEQVSLSPSPSSSSSSSSSFRPRDKWFNLALRDCPAALENIDFWRQSNLEPMIVDIILVQRRRDWEPLNGSSKREIGPNLPAKERYSYYSDNDELRFATVTERIVERWVLRYECKASGGNRAGPSGSKRSTGMSSHTLYKKSILLLRSLYASVRLFPAFKLFRDLISSAQIRSYNLCHRVSSFVEPFTSREEAEMQHFVFAPVDTSCGRLCLSVSYRSSLLDVNSEPLASLSPKFIPEYVGSPMAEPLKRFPSPFDRQHSWSHDMYRASPPSAYPLPSPTYSESRVSLSKHRSCRLPPSSLPHILPDERNPSYDECWPSLTFSPSPSPSPPAFIHGRHLMNPPLRSESAPVNIPASRFSNVQPLPNNPLTPISPPTTATRSLFIRQDANAGGHCKAKNVDKLSSFSENEPGKLSRVEKFSHSTSSISLSFQDDYEDSEFSGPFIVDDDYKMDPCSRPGSFDLLQHPSGSHEPSGLFPLGKSQDAAVGALVRMLKKAPPLQRDILCKSKFETMMNCAVSSHEASEVPNKMPSTSLNVACSRLAASKTTSDALDELRVYRELKDLLLNQGKSPHA